MKTLILGAGGFGFAVREALQLAAAPSHHEVHFLDDNLTPKDISPKIDIVGRFMDLQKVAHSYDNALVALGRNELRQAQMEAIQRIGIPLATAIHPSAVISPLACIEAGSIIMSASVVSINCRIGRGVIINAGTILDHNAIIEDWAHLGVGCRISGGVHIGRSSMLYAGCVVGYGVNMEANTIAAAGSVFRV